MRRRAVVLGALAAPALASRSRAQAKAVTLVSWGGSIQAMLERDGYAAKFKDATGFTIQLVPKNTGPEIVATALAQRARPQVDVVMSDLLPWLAGADQGLFNPIADGAIPNLAGMFPAAKLNDPASGGLRGISPIADMFCLIYNHEAFAKNGWKPPATIDDLARPELAGQVLVPPGTSTYGLYALLLSAKAHGGGEDDIEPGFTAMKKIARNVYDWSDTQAKMAQFLQDGSATVAFYSAASGAEWAGRGIPVTSVVAPPPTLTKWAMGVMKGAPNPEGAQAFINWFVSPGVMTYRVATFNNLTLTKGVEPPAEVAKRLPTPAQVGAATEADYAKMLARREEWVRRFQRDVSSIRG